MSAKTIFPNVFSIKNTPIYYSEPPRNKNLRFNSTTSDIIIFYSTQEIDVNKIGIEIEFINLSCHGISYLLEGHYIIDDDDISDMTPEFIRVEENMSANDNTKILELPTSNAISISCIDEFMMIQFKKPFYLKIKYKDVAGTKMINYEPVRFMTLDSRFEQLFKLSITSKQHYCKSVYLFDNYIGYKLNNQLVIYLRNQQLYYTTINNYLDIIYISNEYLVYSKSTNLIITYHIFRLSDKKIKYCGLRLKYIGRDYFIAYDSYYSQAPEIKHIDNMWMDSCIKNHRDNCIEEYQNILSNKYKDIIEEKNPYNIWTKNEK